VTGSTQGAGKKRQVGRLVFVGLFIAAAAGLTVTSLLPTNVTRLSAEHPALEDRAGRQVRAGCGLSDSKGEGGVCSPLPAVAPGSAVREEEVTFASSLPGKGLARLKGTLSVPEGGVPRPAIILIHGSGPNARDELAPGDLVSKVSPPIAVFKALADFFTHEGLVVLRYDKRNCLRCYPDFERSHLDEFRWPDLERDARDALAFLRTRREVDASALLVAGHSEGGQIAPFVAVGEPGVVGVLMLAGLTETFDVALLAQLDRLMGARLAQADVFGALNVAIGRRPLASCFARLSGPHDPMDKCLGGGVTLEMLADYQAYVQRMPQVLASETCPIFAIQGSVDRNIDPAEMGKLAALLEGKDHELHYVPKVNHLLVDVVDGKSPAVIDADVERRIHTFLGSVKR
jgi:uncharacterized protein